MTIDWISFTPGPALVGGILLGIAAALYMLFNGRILGISGIIGGLLQAKKSDWLWRLSFTLGLLTAALWATYAFDIRVKAVIDADYLTLIIAGLLVGFGARYGSGCTSGHGICGLSRLSPRSLLATMTFMGCGFLMVYVVRHLV
ncbi:MAG: YeeE/YedE family protein [Burkholderiaceae bacterium]|nr:YeeE/YedE family protein [Burkholderiaceae bacterium]